MDSPDNAVYSCSGMGKEVFTTYLFFDHELGSCVDTGKNDLLQDSAGVEQNAYIVPQVHTLRDT